jgi:hypothetical protein
LFYKLIFSGKQMITSDSSCVKVAKCRAIGESGNLWVPNIKMVGIICPPSPLVEKELTDLPKFGRHPLLLQA